MYNATFQQWYNITLPGDYASGTANAAAHYIPNLGPNGLLLFFGGVSAIATYGAISLNRLTMFEPLSQQTTSQRVSRDVPPSVESACVVGAAGENGAHEIFLLGGIQKEVQGWTHIDNSVYVPSLPSFRWTRVPSYGRGRSGATCNVAGNRQMIVTGSTIGNSFDASWSFDRSTGHPDPRPQGLGVFHLTALQWSAQFDPPAAQYTTPTAVRDSNDKNGNAPASYDDSTVKSWFATMRAAPIANTTGRGSSGLGTSTGSSPSTGLGAGAIAGIVVAIVAALALVAAAVLLVLRKRRSHNHVKVTDTDEEYEVPPGFYQSSQLNSYGTAGLHEQHSPPELSGTSKFELGESNNESVYEMARPDREVYELDHTQAWRRQ